MCIWAALLVGAHVATARATDLAVARASEPTVALDWPLVGHWLVVVGALLSSWCLEMVLLVALTRAALTALRGEPPRLGGVVASLRGKWSAIILFALMLESGSLLLYLPFVASSSWAGVAVAMVQLWTFVLYFGIPVLAREPAGGVAAVRRSYQLFRTAWRSRMFGMFLILLRSALIGIVLVAWAIALYLQRIDLSPLFQLVGSMVSAYFIVIDQVFDAALYTNVTEGVFPGPPDGVATAPTWRARASEKPR